MRASGLQPWQPEEVQLLPRLLAPGQLSAGPHRPHSPPRVVEDRHTQAAGKKLELLRPGAGLGGEKREGPDLGVGRAPVSWNL